MSDIGSKDFAEVADLLAPAVGTKIILVNGKKVEIKKITIGEISAILEVSKNNELDQYIWLVYKGVIKPKLTVDHIRAMQHTEVLFIAAEIGKFSGLDKDSMGKLENLLNPKS